jgi:hypothetical protein
MNDKVTGVTQISTLLQQKPLNDPTSHSLAEAHTGDSAINQQRENGKTIPQSLCATDKTSAFIQHGSNVHKRDFNFPGHIFQETTSFFLPCICNHCNGLVSFKTIIIQIFKQVKIILFYSFGDLFYVKDLSTNAAFAIINFAVLVTSNIQQVMCAMM